MKEKKKERQMAITITIPERNYEKLKNISKVTGIGIGTLYKMGEKCPPCLEKLTDGINEFEKRKRRR